MKPMKVSGFFDPAQLRTGHDLLSMLAVAVFGFLNGYCVSLSLIVVIEIPDLSQEQRKTCDFVQAFQNKKPKVSHRKERQSANF